MKKNKVIQGALLAIIAVALYACGGGDAFKNSNTSASTATSTTATSQTATAVTSLSIGANPTSVRSDNSDSSTITVTAVDSSNAAVANVPITFSSTLGLLSASTATTNSTGTATVTFSSGLLSQSNATATITATSGTVSVNVPVQIAGSSISLTSASTTLVAGDTTGAATTQLTVTALNAGNNPVANATVTLVISGTGAATLANSTGATDASGKFTTTITGTGVGTVTVTATGLGVTKTLDLQVQGTSTALQITSPSSSTVTVGQNTPQIVQVSAPNSATVVFVTSLGGWTECSSQSVCPQPVTGGVASATLQAGTSGTASVQVYDPNNVVDSDSMTVLVANNVVTSNSKVVAQALATTVPVSTTSSQYSTTVTATVTDANGAAIYNAPVTFSLVNTTGGGEFVNPSFGLTDQHGQVSTTFTSGSTSSNNVPNGKVGVVASLWDASYNFVASSEADIAINQAAGSVVLSIGSKISSNSANTAYIQPMAVQVTDGQGNPVAGQTVTLHAWPKRFILGYRSNIAPCDPVVAYYFDNEDVNRNLNLDPGEDKAIGEATVDPSGPVDLNGNGTTNDIFDDGILTPANSSAGSLPSTVTTDASGVANFNLTYLKGFAFWLDDEITATTQVSGSETTGVLTFTLPEMVGEGCNLPARSPFFP